MRHHGEFIERTFVEEWREIPLFTDKSSLEKIHPAHYAHVFADLKGIGRGRVGYIPRAIRRISWDKVNIICVLDDILASGSSSLCDLNHYVSVTQDREVEWPVFVNAIRSHPVGHISS